MKPRDFVAFVRDLELSPDVEVRADLRAHGMSVWVEVAARRPDVNQAAFSPVPSTTVEVTLPRVLTYEEVEGLDEAGALRIVRDLWRRLWDHEFTEWTRRGGSPLYDPHGTRRSAEEATRAKVMRWR